MNIDISKFPADIQERLASLMVDMQDCGDTEVLFVVGGAHVDMHGEPGLKTTARFVGIDTPLDMILLLSAMVRAFSTICTDAGIPERASKLAAHTAVDFALDKTGFGPRTITKDEHGKLSNREPDDASKIIAEAMIAAMMGKSKPDVH